MSRKLKVDRIQINKCACSVTNYINKKSGENNNKKNTLRLVVGKCLFILPTTSKIRYSSAMLYLFLDFFKNI